MSCLALFIYVLKLRFWAAGDCFCAGQFAGRNSCLGRQRLRDVGLQSIGRGLILDLLEYHGDLMGIEWESHGIDHQP